MTGDLDVYLRTLQDYADHARQRRDEQARLVASLPIEGKARYDAENMLISVEATLRQAEGNLEFVKSFAEG